MEHGHCASGLRAWLLPENCLLFGLMTNIGRSQIGFAHEDLASYFVAQHLWENNSLSLVEPGYLYSWSRPLLLAAGLSPRSDQVIEYLLNDVSPYRLLLASDIIRDGIGTEAAKEKVQKILSIQFEAEWARKELLRIGAVDPFVQSLVVCAPVIRKKVLEDSALTHLIRGGSPRIWVSSLLKVPDSFSALKDLAARELQDRSDALDEIFRVAAGATVNESWRLHRLLESLANPFRRLLPTALEAMLKILDSPNLIVAAAAAKIAAERRLPLDVIRPALDRIKSGKDNDIRVIGISIYRNLLPMYPQLFKEAACWALSDTDTYVSDRAVWMTKGRLGGTELANEPLVIEGMIRLLGAYRRSMGWGRTASPPGKALAHLAIYNHDIIPRVIQVAIDETSSQVQMIEAPNCLYEICERVEGETKITDELLDFHDEIDNSDRIPIDAVTGALRQLVATMPADIGIRVVSLIPDATGDRPWLVPVLLEWITAPVSPEIGEKVLESLDRFAMSGNTQVRDALSSGSTELPADLQNRLTELISRKLPADRIYETVPEHIFETKTELADPSLQYGLTKESPYAEVVSSSDQQLKLGELQNQLESDSLVAFASAAKELGQLGAELPEALVILERYLKTSPQIRWLAITEALVNAGRVTPEIAERYVRAIHRSRLGWGEKANDTWALLKWLLDTFDPPGAVLYRTIEMTGSLVENVKGRGDIETIVAVKTALKEFIRDTHQASSLEISLNWQGLLKGKTNSNPVIRSTVGQALLILVERNFDDRILVMDLLYDSEVLVCEAIADGLVHISPQKAIPVLESVLLDSPHPRLIEETLVRAKKLGGTDERLT